MMPITKRPCRSGTLIKRGFDACFEQADVLLTPAAPTTAYPLGFHAEDPIRMYLGDIYTVSVNMGRPAGACDALRL